MKKLLSLVLVALMILSSISVFATESEQNTDKWVHLELQDAKEQIIEVVLDKDMFFATYLINTSNSEIVVEETSENSDIVPTSTYAPGVSGGTALTERAGKSKAGKYKFIIKSLDESNLSGIFSYMVSEDLNDFATACYPEEILANRINIYHNGVLLDLTNKQFVENEVLYIPLRELFEKAGIVDNKDSYITWNDGKIEIMAIEKADNKDLSYHYGIEIDKAEYVLNPGKEELYQQKFNISNKKEMNRAPMLIGDKTYVPYEYIDCMINKVMQTCKITYSEN